MKHTHFLTSFLGDTREVTRNVQKEETYVAPERQRQRQRLEDDDLEYVDGYEELAWLEAGETDEQMQQAVEDVNSEAFAAIIASRRAPPSAFTVLEDEVAARPSIDEILGEERRSDDANDFVFTACYWYFIAEEHRSAFLASTEVRCLLNALEPELLRERRTHVRQRQWVALVARAGAIFVSVDDRLFERAPLDGPHAHLDDEGAAHVRTITFRVAIHSAASTEETKRSGEPHFLDAEANGEFELSMRAPIVGHSFFLRCNFHILPEERLCLLSMYFTRTI